MVSKWEKQHNYLFKEAYFQLFQKNQEFNELGLVFPFSHFGTAIFNFLLVALQLELNSSSSRPKKHNRIGVIIFN